MEKQLRSANEWMGPETAGDLRPTLPLLERIGGVKSETCSSGTAKNSKNIGVWMKLICLPGGSQTVVKVVSTVYDWLLPRPEFGKFFLACPLKLGHSSSGSRGVVCKTCFYMFLFLYHFSFHGVFGVLRLVQLATLIIEEDGTHPGRDQQLGSR